MDRSGYQIGGIVLLLAGLSAAVGSSLHGPQPQNLEAFSQLGASWAVSHVAIAIAGALFAVSSIALLRHFAGSGGEGWAIVGSGMLLLGGVALLMIGVWETSGFSGLAAAQEAGAGAAAEHAYLATLWVMSSMATAAGFLFPTALAAYGLAMFQDSGWPGWLAGSAVVIGLASLAASVFGLPLGVASVLLQYAGDAWYALAGLLLLGRGRAATVAIQA